jgi:hypothetical protein
MYDFCDQMGEIQKDPPHPPGIEGSLGDDLSDLAEGVTPEGAQTRNGRMVCAIAMIRRDRKRILHQARCG